MDEKYIQDTVKKMHLLALEQIDTHEEVTDSNIRMRKLDLCKLSDTTIEKILDAADDIHQLLDEVKKEATQRILKGHKFERYFARSGSTRYTYKDEDAVIETANEMGIDPFEKKLMSPAKLKKKVSADEYAAFVPYIENTTGRPVLVRYNTCCNKNDRIRVNREFYK